MSRLVGTCFRPQPKTSDDKLPGESVRSHGTRGIAGIGAAVTPFTFRLCSHYIMLFYCVIVILDPGYPLLRFPFRDRKQVAFIDEPERSAQLPFRSFGPLHLFVTCTCQFNRPAGCWLLLLLLMICCNVCRARRAQHGLVCMNARQGLCPQDLEQRTQSHVTVHHPAGLTTCACSSHSIVVSHGCDECPAAGTRTSTSPAICQLSSSSMWHKTDH